jgi:hypothetical protein
MQAVFNFGLVTEARASALFDVLVGVGQMRRENEESARAEFVSKVLKHELTEYTYSTVDGKRPTLFIDLNYVVRFSDGQKSNETSEFERKVYDELLDLFARWNLEDSVNLFCVNEENWKDADEKHHPWG